MKSNGCILTNYFCFPDRISGMETNKFEVKGRSFFNRIVLKSPLPRNSRLVCISIYLSACPGVPASSQPGPFCLQSNPRGRCVPWNDWHDGAVPACVSVTAAVSCAPWELRECSQGCPVCPAGFNPVWEETLTFTIHMPEMALVRFLVWDHDPIGRDFVGQRTVAFSSLVPGEWEPCSPAMGIQLRALLPWESPSEPRRALPARDYTF